MNASAANTAKKIKKALVSTGDLDVLPLTLGEGPMRTFDTSFLVGAIEPRSWRSGRA